MALQGINSVPEPNEQNQIKQQSEENAKDNSKFSIFDTNQDGTVTVAEQQEALREAVNTDATIQEAVKKGFDPYTFIDTLGDVLEDIKANVPKMIGKLIVNSQQMVAYADSQIQSQIDTIKAQAKDFLDNKSSSNIGSKQNDNSEIESMSEKIEQTVESFDWKSIIKDKKISVDEQKDIFCKLATQDLSDFANLLGIDLNSLIEKYSKGFANIDVTKYHKDFAIDLAKNHILDAIIFTQHELIMSYYEAKAKYYEAKANNISIN